MADTTTWRPDKAEVQAILEELRPILDEFARHDHEFLEATAREHKS